MAAELYIQNMEKDVFAPVLAGSITWETERKGQPGKLTFTMLWDSILKIEEGNAVRLDVDGTPIFFGFLFERSWTKDGEIKAVAYDQLRYLKNKETYYYENLNAGEVIEMIARDFHLQTGELQDTGYKIEYRAEQDKTLFDTILSALDITMTETGQIYVFYDDVGKLTLKSIGNMKLDVLISDTTAQDYDFKTSIDNNSYNQIKLYYDNKETNEREVYMVKHTENINKWGVLQLDESIQNRTEGQKKAEVYLTLYNKPSKSLSIKEAFGDIRVRAGCLIPVILDIRDMKMKNYMLAESVKHKFDAGIHTMDLILKGADIYA